MNNFGVSFLFTRSNDCLSFMFINEFILIILSQVVFHDSEKGILHF